MKLLDFLKSLNSGAKPAIAADQLDSERRALLDELQALQDLLGADAAQINAGATAAIAEQIATIDLQAIFEHDADNPPPTPPAPTPPQRELTRSLLEELRQLQQKTLDGAGD